MSLRVVVAPRAVRDLSTLFEDLFDRAGARTAKRWRTKLHDKISLIGQQPLAYAIRPELGETRRIVVVRPYVIVYVVGPDQVLVLRVLHGARDLPQALAE